METKICTKCGRELPLDCFSKCKSSKDGLQAYCKDCNKQYYQDNRELILEQKKQYNAEHAEEKAAYNKQYNATHREELKQYKAEHYATIEGYAYNIRHANLTEDRKRGRCGEDEDPLPPLSYYIENLSEGIDFYDDTQHPFNELGFDRIDNTLPHTIDNMVVATTEHNVDRWHKRMTVEQYRAYIQKQNEELELVL